MALTKIDDRGLTTPIDLLDNEKIRFGTGNDGEIYFDGTDSIFTSAGKFRFKHGTDTAIKTLVDGGVYLSHDNSIKFYTTASGIFVGGHIDLDDNSELQIGTEDDLKIYHNGTHSEIADAGTGDLRLLTSKFKVLNNPASADENMIVATENGAVELYYDGSKKLETTSTGVSIDGHLTVNTGTTDVVADFKSTDANAWIQLRDDHTNDTAVMIGANDDSMMLRAGSNTRMLIAHNGNVGIGTESPKSFSTQISLTINGPSVGRLDCIADGSGGGGIYGTATSTKVFANSGSTLYLDTAASTDLRLSVNGTDIAKVKSNKDFEIVDGNLVVAAGHGIDFSANSHESGMSSELLDSYEEGTFTPQLAGSTNHGSYEVAGHGTYTKIGRYVHLMIAIANVDLDNNAAGTVLIKNLPFSYSNQVSGAHTPRAISSNMMTHNVSLSTSGDNNTYCFYMDSAGMMQGMRNNDGTGWSSWDVADWTSGTMYLDFTMDYITND